MDFLLHILGNRSFLGWWWFQRVSGLYLVRILVPLERLKQNHEVAGFTFGVIGAFYGLLLAFVIVAVWERFDRADPEVQGESVRLPPYTGCRRASPSLLRRKCKRRFEATRTC